MIENLPPAEPNTRVAAENDPRSPSVAPILKELDHLFYAFNKKFFNNALSKPVITLSQKGTKAAKGWCTEKKVWIQTEGDSSSDRFYEINICPEYLNQPIEEICGVLLHEMVHLFNMMNGIRDCSSSGQYHNKFFKESAEQHGLNAEKTTRYGYAQTSLKPGTNEFIKQLNLTAFDLYRDSVSVQKMPQGSENTASAKRASSTRTYICPKCNMLIRATKKVRVRCDSCNVLFQERQEFEREKSGVYTPRRRIGEKM